MHYTMEELCDKLGVTARTLHYYEEIGLIRDVPRTEGGHRYFDEELVTRLEHILRLKDLLGFSLQEIKEVLSAEEDLDLLRTSYQREKDGRERAKLLDQATDLLSGLVERLDRRMKKLETLRSGFVSRLERARLLRQEEEEK